MDEVILERPEPGIGVLRFNRPDVRNALNTRVRELIEEHLECLSEDSESRVVILTGGPEVFAAGADLKEQAGRTVVGAIEAYTHQAIWRCRLPVIAAVNGDAFGGGCELMLQCDLVIASASARFAQPEVSLGIVPGGGATQRLPRAVGRLDALYMLLTGAPVDASSALSMGLVNEVVGGDAYERALELARVIASKPPLAVRQIKEVVRLGLDSPFEVGIALERRSYQLMFGTEDLREGISAFMDGRPSSFKGR